VLKLKFSFLIILCFLFANCKTDKKAGPYKSDLKVTENLSDFTSKMTEKDTVKILAVLDMEWWMRHDELTITKKNDKIQLQTTVKEDTTILEPLEYVWRINKLETITLDNINNEFEKHFFQKLERSKADFNKSLIYKVMTINDTLVFYTKGLGDKGGEVKDYLRFMHHYYPIEKDFIPFGEKLLNE